MKKNQVAAITYTLRDSLQNKSDSERYPVFKALKEMGVSAVQVSGMGTYDPKTLRSMLDDLELEVCATHENQDELRTNPDGVGETCQLLRCAHTACPHVGDEYRSEEGYKRLADELNTCADKLEPYGVTLSYHNHSFEFQRYGNKTGLEILYEYTDPKKVKAELDTYWIQHGGASPEAWIKKMAGRIPVMHFKDLTIVNNEQRFAEVGMGNLNWEGIIPLCEAGGTQWYVIEQDTCEREPIDSVRLSVEYLQKHFVK